MTRKYNIIYFRGEHIFPIVIDSSDRQKFFDHIFDGPYLDDNIYSNIDAVNKAGYGFFKAVITVQYWHDGEHNDTRIDDIQPIQYPFEKLESLKSKED